MEPAVGVSYMVERLGLHQFPTLSLFLLLSNVKPDLNQGIFVHIALPGVCPRASKFLFVFLVFTMC